MDQLSEDVIAHILHFLPTRDQARCRRVCQMMKMSAERCFGKIYISDACFRVRLDDPLRYSNKEKAAHMKAFLRAIGKWVREVRM